MKFDKILQELVVNHGLKYYIYNDEKHIHLPLAVKLEFVFEGITYESWGVSRNKDLAFFKATMELVERTSLNFFCPIIFKKHFFSKSILLDQICEKFKIPPGLIFPDNSNGMAIGISRRMAKANAKKELIERHTILTALLMKISPTKVTSRYFPESLIEGHNLSFYYWKSNNMFIVVCLDRLRNGGYLTTYSCSHSLRGAVNRSFEEIIPNIIYANQHPEKKVNFELITKNNIMSFSNYWKFSGDNRLFNFFEGPVSNNKIPELNHIFYGECVIPVKFKKFSFPIFCYRAISPEAQQLFFDNWSYEYINPLYKHHSLPDFPHFIS
jgi:hypothetical protein